MGSIVNDGRLVDMLVILLLGAAVGIGTILGIWVLRLKEVGALVVFLVGDKVGDRPPPSDGAEVLKSIMPDMLVGDGVALLGEMLGNSNDVGLKVLFTKTEGIDVFKDTLVDPALGTTVICEVP